MGKQNREAAPSSSSPMPVTATIEQLPLWYQIRIADFITEAGLNENWLHFLWALYDGTRIEPGLYPAMIEDLLAKNRLDKESYEVMRYDLAYSGLRKMVLAARHGFLYEEYVAAIDLRQQLLEVATQPVLLGMLKVGQESIYNVKVINLEKAGSLSEKIRDMEKKLGFVESGEETKDEHFEASAHDAQMALREKRRREEEERKAREVEDGLKEIVDEFIDNIPKKRRKKAD